MPKGARFRLNIDVRKEKEDSWLNAIKAKTCVRKRPTEF